MTEGLDKNFAKTRMEFRAEDYVRGLKLLEAMNEMASIERVKDTLEYSVDHPYWHGTPEDRQKVLAIVDAQLELLKALFPRSGKGVE